MKRFITALLFMVTVGFASTSFGQINSSDIDLRGLSETEKASIVAQAEKLRVAKKAGPLVTPDGVKAWASVGKEIGQGLAAAAKELGVAANELLNTPIGYLTAGLLVWVYAGQDLVGIVFGSVWLIAFVPIWLWMYRRFMFKTTIKYFEKGEGPGGAKKVVTKDRIPAVSDGEGFIVFFYVIILLIGTGVGLIAIFG